MFGFALSKGSLEDCARDAINLDASLPQLKESLRAPVRRAGKLELLVGAVPDSCDDFRRFLHLVVRHGRENDLKFIIKSFMELYRKEKGIVEAWLTVASAPAPGFLSGLEQLTLEMSHGTRAEIHVKIDPGLIGGFVFRVGDKYADASVRRQIEALRKKYSTGISRIV